MSEEKRFELLREIMEISDLKKLNKMTLYCLIATMTDVKLEEFYSEFIKIK